MKRNNDIRNDILKNCPILYQMKSKPMDKTCMCWGFECGNGWDEVLQETSYKLELLNLMFYPKHRVRIQADQVKEKFGTLRFYYSISVDSNKFLTSISELSESIYNKLRRLDYNVKKVVDIEPYDYEDTEVLSKEQYEEESKLNVANVKFITTEDNKIVKLTKLRNYGKSHHIPTKHKIAYYVMKFFDKLSEKFKNVQYKKDLTKEQVIISDTLYSLANEIIRDAEKKCKDVCEKCGHQIGTDWNPTCITFGWIKYLCEDCACENEHATYKKDGKKYQNRKLVEDTKVQ